MFEETETVGTKAKGADIGVGSLATTSALPWHHSPSTGLSSGVAVGRNLSSMPSGRIRQMGEGVEAIICRWSLILTGPNFEGQVSPNQRLENGK